MRDSVYAGAATVASTVSVSAGSLSDGPMVLPLGGVPIPIVPAIIGILATILVRVIVVTRSPRTTGRPLRVYNIAVTLLAVLGAVTYISDHNLGPGSAFWTGIGCGAAGVTMVEIGRSKFLSALREGLRVAYETMNKPKTD
jgi:hypothetical protein